MSRLADAIERLARTWWQVDRVRVSPDEGRLLRLRPPCYIRIGAETIEVLGRRVAEQNLGVVYECEGGAELRVCLIALSQPLQIRWGRQGKFIELMPQDIEVFSPEQRMPKI